MARGYRTPDDMDDSRTLGAYTPVPANDRDRQHFAGYAPPRQHHCSALLLLAYFLFYSVCSYESYSGGGSHPSISKVGGSGTTSLNVSGGRQTSRGASVGDGFDDEETLVM